MEVERLKQVYKSLESHYHNHNERSGKLDKELSDLTNYWEVIKGSRQPGRTPNDWTPDEVEANNSLRR